MRAFVFGHSHVWSIRRAITASELTPSPEGEVAVDLLLCGTKEFPGPLVSRTADGREHLNAALIAGLARVGATPEDALISMVQGNQFNSLCLTQDAQPFDICVPGWPRPNSSLPKVPYSAFYKALADQFQEFKSFAERLKTLKYKMTLHVAPPPPVPDNAFIQSKLAEIGDGKPPVVSHPELRLKAWTVQSEIMRRIVEASGGIFIPPPPQAVDALGFLKKEFWNDSVHANGAYGSLQLDAFRRACQ